MSDTPPPELVDRLARIVHAYAYAYAYTSIGPERGAWVREPIDAVLAALAEWADGGLIDPSTWTVVEAKRETGWCVFMGHGPDCECDDGARWVLSPREGER